MAADGSSKTRVTSNSNGDVIGDWSPDGEWLALYRPQGEPEQGLFLRNPDGVNLVQLTSEQDSGAVWSPDGDSIAFVRNDGENLDIYVVRRLKDGTWQDATELNRLTQHEAADHSPAWSPDSETIAFVFRPGWQRRGLHHGGRRLRSAAVD